VRGTCKLCLTEGADLQDSHLMPKAGYRRLREDGSPPYVVREVKMFKDEQVHAHVFCRDCEDRFNRNGEAWVLKHCYNDDAHSFLLHDLLLASTPFLADREVTVFSAATIPGNRRVATRLLRV
jgi:hypothetical protein